MEYNIAANTDPEMVDGDALPNNNNERITYSEKPSDNNAETRTDENQPMKEKSRREIQPLIWSNVVIITIWHLIGLYAFCIYFIRVKFLTLAWGKYLGELMRIIHILLLKPNKRNMKIYKTKIVFLIVCGRQISC